MLPLYEGQNKWYVLSAEFSGNGLSLVMMPENEEPVCYKLPVEYSEWAMTVVGMANKGENIPRRGCFFFCLWSILC